MTLNQRIAARRRVKSMTGWIAATATVLTAGFAFGAARHANAAKPAAAKAPTSTTTTTTTAPSATPAETGTAVPSSSYDSQLQAPTTPPVASSSPPAATSSGS